MKKQYIEPKTFLNDYIEPIMEQIGVGSEPGDNDEILGKDRKDDFENSSEESKDWTDGLW